MSEVGNRRRRGREQEEALLESARRLEAGRKKLVARQILDLDLALLQRFQLDGVGMLERRDLGEEIDGLKNRFVDWLFLAALLDGEREDDDRNLLVVLRRHHAHAPVGTDIR